MLDRTGDQLRAWASDLGMVPVPMFAKGRAARIPGDHVVLLDGDRASFALSILTSDDNLDPDQSLGWSWSSNVRHSVIFDARRSALTARRWDAPDQLSELAEASAHALASLVEKFESLGPPLGPTVIERALNAFRAIRLAVQERGGNNLDVILVFNSLLVWAEASKRRLINGNLNRNADLSQALDALGSRGLWRADSNALSASVRTFPIAEMTEILLDGEAGDRYVLDPDLLIRHASGRLFQEANIQLERQPVGQQRLFVDVPDHAPKPVGAAKRDAHFTPPSLARLLVQRAIAESKLDDGGSELTILDPACGSGVFLVEAMRETAGSRTRIRLRGIDNSSVAVAMARFTLDRTMADAGRGMIDVEIEEGDSLSSADWGEPDLIVMNPPFSSWRLMPLAARNAVKNALGDLYLGRSDASVAFVAKAIKAIKPGGALAAVVPSAMLESEAAAGLRRFVQSNPEYSIRMVGRFRGYGYFREATVEPGFLVVSRAPRQQGGATTFVMAESGYEDQAIRAVRNLSVDRGNRGYEIFRGELAATASSWLPRPQRAAAVIDALRSNVQQTVGSLFDTRLGVRTGANDVMLVTDNDLRGMCQTANEMRCFRPVADSIAHAEIEKSLYIFYPYGPDRRRLFKTEQELAAAVPGFYQERLKPNKTRLAARRSLRARHWWELVEPRVPWLAARNKKIVMPAFGRGGSFAYDETGEFVVVQGTAWFWKRADAETPELPWAYIALFNSVAFECLLSHFCTRVGGGQYELYRKFTEQIPIPDLTRVDATLVSTLARAGRSLGRGKELSLSALDEMVCSVYGLAIDEFRRACRVSDSPTVRKVLAELSSAWKKGTAHHSAMSQMKLHPAYGCIVEFGFAAVPFILSRMQKGEGRWFDALETITGENPVPAALRGNVAAMIDEWLRWGTDRGYVA